MIRGGALVAGVILIAAKLHDLGQRELAGALIGYLAGCLLVLAVLYGGGRK